MRQSQNAKRGRGRGRRGNGNGNYNQVPNRNTSYESNGPDVKLRGNAQQLHEKYMVLAHDAATAGERITAEAYTQFADHYFRIHQAAVGVAESKRQQDQNVPGESLVKDVVAVADGAPADDASVMNGFDEVALAPKRGRGIRKPSNGRGSGAAKGGDTSSEDNTNLSPTQLTEAVLEDQDGKRV
jgi:hypothetical protein